MPIEIKELVIRAVVDNPDERAATAAPDQVDVGAIVEECVRQVLRVLKRQQER